jgi:hypothetical protein
MVRVRGFVRVCQIHYRTHTRRTRDPKPAGFSIPMRKPILVMAPATTVMKFKMIESFPSHPDIAPSHLNDKLIATFKMESIGGSHKSTVQTSSSACPMTLQKGAEVDFTCNTI